MGLRLLLPILESWYEYFNTGNPKHYFDLMKTLIDSNEREASLSKDGEHSDIEVQLF